MRKRKYKFTDKSQSKCGIISSVIGVLAISLTAGMVAVAYLQGGQAGKFVAIPGFLALLLSFVGMFYGVRGTKEEETYHLFPWLGCLMNGLTLAAYVLIYILGW